MATPRMPTNYEKLVRRTQPPPAEQKTSETELDSLIALLDERRAKENRQAAGPDPDPIQTLREKTVREFIPIFIKLVEKYARSGINLEMDASNLLQGGRELRFEFTVGQYRSVLNGTATTEGIAFHETRCAPDIRGERMSEPILRLRSLTGAVFHDFVCERLSILVRTALRRR